MSIWRTAPWLRAPLLLFRRPVVVVAVGATCVLLAVAAASGPLFLASVGAAALNRAASVQCPEADAPTVRRSDAQSAKAIERADAEVRGAVSATGLPAPYRVTVAQPTASLGQAGQVQQITVYNRPDATGQVDLLRGSDRPGLWISDLEAARQGVRLGDVVTVGAVRLPIVAVYRDLAGPGFGAQLSPYWCTWSSLILPGLERQPPPFFLADNTTMGSIATELASGNDVTDFTARPTWYSPVSADQLTLTEAADVLDRQDRLARRLHSVTPASGTPGYLVETRLDDDLRSATATRDGIGGAITPIALAGIFVAILLVGAAASFWVDQRRSEIRLLNARGASPTALAAKACLEMALPAVIGTVIGWAIAISLVRVLGPAQRLEPGAPWSSLVAVVPASAGGLAAVAVVAGLRSSGQLEAVVRRGRRGWWRLVPWEAVLLLVAVGALIALRRTGAVAIDDRGVIRVNPMLVAFPLLAMTGVLLLLARGAGGQLSRLRRWTAHAPINVYLAARRLAGLRSATAAVLVATAVPVGILVYAASVSRSMDATVTAKSATYAGTQHALVLNARPGETFHLDGTGTQVSVLADVTTVAGVDTQVLGIDPETFAKFAYSDPDVLGFRLGDLIARLKERDANGAIPAIAVRCSSCAAEVPMTLASSKRTARIVGTADLFPGIRVRDAALLVVPRTALADIDPYANRVEEVWTNTQSLSAAQRILQSNGQEVRREVTPDKFIGVTQLLPVAWTFGYLQALSVLTGLISAAGLFLYLSARQRSTLLAYVMLRRIGITRRAHFASLGSEIGGLLLVGWAMGVGASVAAVLTVYRLLDLNTSYSPGAQLVIPVSLLAVSVALLLGVALIGSFSTQRTADAVEPAVLLRGAQ